MTITKLNTAAEIKSAVDAGKTVYCDGGGYKVIKTGDDYLIKYSYGDYCVGLTGMPGTKYEDSLNGSNFYIEE